MDIDRFSRLTKASASVRPFRSRERCSRGATSADNALMKAHRRCSIRHLDPDRDDDPFSEQRRARRACGCATSAVARRAAGKRSRPAAPLPSTRLGSSSAIKEAKCGSCPSCGVAVSSSKPSDFAASTSAKPAPLVFLADAMMRLVDDHQVPGDALQLRQHAILLGEIDRGQTQRGRVERIAAEFQAAPGVLQPGAIGDDGEAQARSGPASPAPTGAAADRAGTRSGSDGHGGGPAVRQRSGRPGWSCRGRRRRPAAASAAPCPAPAAGARADRPRSRPGRAEPPHPESAPATGRCDSGARRPDDPASSGRGSVREHRQAPRLDTARPIPARPDRRRRRPAARAAGAPSGSTLGHIPFQPAGRDLDPDRHFHAGFPSKRGHGNTATDCQTLNGHEGGCR